MSDEETNRTTLLWLDPRVFDGDIQPEDSSGTGDYTHLQRYDDWEHAESLLSGSSCEQRNIQIDALTTLKRLIASRIDHLTIHLGLIPAIRRARIDKYAMLEQLGVIRPLMLKELYRLRNLVEHQHQDPQSLEILLRLLDFSWYLLRSTDLLLRWDYHSFSIKSEVDVTVRTSCGAKARSEVRGAAPSDLISTDPHDDWVSGTGTLNPLTGASKVKLVKMKFLSTPKDSGYGYFVQHYVDLVLYW